MRQRIRSGYDYERDYGYSRAVRVGDLVFVSGTTARGAALALDTEGQLRDIVATVGAALAEAGATPADVVRTVAYMRSMNDADALARVHREAFGGAAPASTMVEVSALSPGEARIEIEVTAVVGSAE